MWYSKAGSAGMVHGVAVRVADQSQPPSRIQESAATIPLIIIFDDRAQYAWTC